nr:hypothetical protein Iba_chr05bCG8180 [Ipomoea batatas]
MASSLLNAKAFCRAIRHEGASRPFKNNPLRESRTFNFLRPIATSRVLTETQ